MPIQEQFSIKNNIFCIAFFFILSLMLNFFNHSIVDWLFLNDHFHILNFIGRCAENRSLDFYYGVFLERIFGPLSILLSGMALLMICLRYEHQLNSWRFAFLVFGYWMITKFEVLFFPPYGDAVSGPFIEAVWLLHNQFNYIKLANEIVFVDGGPKVYLISIYPTFQAVLMKLLHDRDVFLVINHLIVFGLGAVIVAVLRGMFAKIFHSRISIYLTLIFCFLPIFQSQVEQINMEIPLLVFVVLAVDALMNKKILRAAIYAALASFVKVYSLYTGFAVFLIALLLFFFNDEQQRDLKVLFSGFLSLLFVFLGAYGLLFVVNTDAQVDKVGVFQGWHLIKKFPSTYFFFSVFFLFLLRFFVYLRKNKSSISKAFLRFVNERFVILVAHICALGWFVMFLNSKWIPPRYTIILLPSLIFCIAEGVIHLFKKQRALEVVLCVVLAITMLSSYGLFYPEIRLQDHSVTERSLEYRNDIKLHMDLARTIENKFPSFLIGAPFTFAQILAFPEIGYVRKKLDVMIYLYPCRYGDVKNFTGLDELKTSKVLWVGVDTPFVRSEFFPNGPLDRVIFRKQVGNKSYRLFFGGFSINIVYERGKTIVDSLKGKGLLRNTF